MAYDCNAKNLYVADIGLHKILACSVVKRKCATIIKTIAYAISVDSVNGLVSACPFATLVLCKLQVFVADIAWF